MDIEQIIDQQADIEALIKSPQFDELPETLRIEVRSFHLYVATVLNELANKSQQIVDQYDEMRRGLYGTSVKAAVSLIVPSEPASSEGGTAK